LIADEPETFAHLQALQAFLGLLDRRRGELQARAHPLGRRAFAEKPGALADRFEAYWSVRGVSPKKARRAAPHTPITT
jgi:hypothetical protein